MFGILSVLVLAYVFVCFIQSEMTDVPNTVSQFSV